MKKTIFIFLALTRLGFSCSDSFEWHMNQYWLMFSCKAYEQANEYLTDLIESNDVPNIDKVHYLYYRHLHFYKNNNQTMLIVNSEILKNLIEKDPCCLEEFEKYKYDFIQ